MLWSPIQTAYLKAHYPTEFMAAVLSSEMDGAERDKFFVEHIDDCRRMGIEVLPPNINEGQLDFRVAGEGTVHFGLGAIKGVGFKAVEAIVKAREQGGPFPSLDDFFERVPTKDVGAGCVETLIHAGAFDCLGAKRSQLLASCRGHSRPGRPSRTTAAAASAGLFDDLESAARSKAKANGNGHVAASARAARSPRVVRRREAGRREEGAGLLYVEPSLDPTTRLCSRPWRPTGSPTWRPRPRRPRSSWAA